LSTFILLGLTTWWFLFGQDTFKKRQQQHQKRKPSLGSTKFNDRKRKASPKIKPKYVKSFEPQQISKSLDKSIDSREDLIASSSASRARVLHPKTDDISSEEQILIFRGTKVKLNSTTDYDDSEDATSNEIDTVESFESHPDVTAISFASTTSSSGRNNVNDDDDDDESEWEQVGSKSPKIERPKPTLFVFKRKSRKNITPSSPVITKKLDNFSSLPVPVTSNTTTTITPNNNSISFYNNDIKKRNTTTTGKIIFSIKGVSDGDFAAIICDLLELKIVGIERVSINLVADPTMSIRYCCCGDHQLDIQSIIQILEDLNVKATLITDVIPRPTKAVGPIIRPTWSSYR